jgi:ankyrin repeat protein
MWLDTEKQTLFCPGIPGAGKTILTAIVVDNLATRFAGNLAIGIAYIYYNFRRQDEQKAEELLASLLKQLTQGRSSLPDSVKSLHDKHKDKRTRPSLAEISKALQSVAAMYSRVFIVVDALDECQASNGCRARFLLEIFNLQAKCQASLFATSRFIPEITEKFEGSIALEIRATEQDVRRYVDGHISHLASFVGRNLDLQEEIKTEIVKAVDGMYMAPSILICEIYTHFARFLLAQLHLDSLKGKRSPKAISIALTKLPTGSEAYDYAYKDAMERIEGQLSGEEELAKQALLWITCAKRPLTTSELEHALAVEIGQSQLDEQNLCQVEDIVSVCAGLVTIDEESGIIRLVHYTTQEYFERTQNNWFPNGEADITIICITYLLFRIFENGCCQTDAEFEERLQTNKLFDYAAHNWGHHARKASTLCHEVMDLLECKAKVEASIQALIAVKKYLRHSNYSQEVPKQMTGLHLAAYFGVQEATNSLLEHEHVHTLDLRDNYGRTPLSWAAENGREAVVKLLLEKGAELEVKDSYGQTPLSCATMHGQEAIVKLLLEKGAELEAKDIYSQTPLLCAAMFGQEAIVKLLLEKGAELEAKDSYGQTPLLCATIHGQEAIVKLLLEKGAELEAKDSYSQTPLLCAAMHGQEAIVKLLLEKGAELEAKDSYSQTPLLCAVIRGREAVVKLLLKEGAELELRGSYSRTPLLCAAMFGQEAMVKLLLEEGAELEAKDSYSQTPLLCAALFGQEAIVKLLLEEGAELEAKDNNSRTPLSWARRNNHENIIKLLTPLT